MGEVPPQDCKYVHPLIRDVLETYLFKTKDCFKHALISPLHSELCISVSDTYPKKLLCASVNRKNIPHFNFKTIVSQIIKVIKNYT